MKLPHGKLPVRQVVFGLVHGRDLGDGVVTGVRELTLARFEVLHPLLTSKKAKALSEHKLIRGIQQRIEQATKRGLAILFDVEPLQITGAAIGLKLDGVGIDFNPGVANGMACFPRGGFDALPLRG